MLPSPLAVDQPEPEHGPAPGADELIGPDDPGRDRRLQWAALMQRAFSCDVLASNGTVLEERRCPTRALGGRLAAMPKSRIVVETCAEAFGVADAALEHGHEVRVVPAALVRSLGVGARRTKTDRRDAQTLSEVSCRIDLPSVHVPDRESRRRKSLCGMREALVREARRDDLLDRPLAAVHAGPQPKNYAFAEAGLRGRAQDALDAAEGLTLCTLGTPPFPFRHPTTWTGRPGGLPWMRR